MVSVFAFNSGDGDEEADEEIALSKPNAYESNDLEIHVDRCAARYALVYKRLGRLKRGFSRIENVVWLILVIEAVTNPVALKIWTALGL